MRRVNCKTCDVKNEKLDFLSDNTKYTLRFAMQIGGLWRAMTIKDVSRHMRLDWHTVKELEKNYMREQLRLAGPPQPKVIGVDEISIRHYTDERPNCRPKREADRL
jgi:transposase